MAHHNKSAEGDANQKRAAAREAKAHGKKPSEVGATTGASGQTKSAPNNATHQEKMDLKHEGKALGDKTTDNEHARPGSRETDPQRD